MGRQRTRWNKATKFKVALEAYKGDREAVAGERDELYRKVGHQQVQIDFTAVGHSVSSG